MTVYNVLQWFDLDMPESAQFPMSYSKLHGFQRLLLLRCFRVDRIYRAVTEYVSRVMGEKYVMPPVISFESIFEQSTPLCPIVFILSPGADPATDLMKLAERMGFGAGKLKGLSLGQGQEKVRIATIKQQFITLYIILTATVGRSKTVKLHEDDIISITLTFG